LESHHEVAYACCGQRENDAERPFDEILGNEVGRGAIESCGPLPIETVSFLHNLKGCIFRES